MFSDSELQRIEATIARHRADLTRLDYEFSELHEKERHAIDRIQRETERDVSTIEHRKQNLQREIDREEQLLASRRTELEREHRKQMEHH